MIARGRLIGRGTFVTGGARVVRSLGQNFIVSFGEEMRRAGMAPSIEELSLGLVEPPPTARERLRIGPQGRVYLHKKVIRADAVPVCYDRSYFPERLGRSIMLDLKNKFSLEILVDRKMPIDHFKCQMQSGAANAEEAEALRIGIGAPILKMLLVPIGPNGQAIFVGDFVFPAHWFAFEFDVPPPSPGRFDEV